MKKLLAKFFGSIWPLTEFRWYRKLVGGHWEKWLWEGGYPTSDIGWDRWYRVDCCWYLSDFPRQRPSEGCSFFPWECEEDGENV